MTRQFSALYSALLFLVLVPVTATASDLQPVTAADESRAKEIADIALQWWFKNRGLLAEESWRVVGSFRVARPIPGFAERDDPVYEVRIRHLHTQGPSGILWVNARTEKVIALGAPVSESLSPLESGR